MKLSTVILAKNEENNIERAIKSVAFCDEILVIDDDSTDNTLQIAAKSGATIVTHTLNNDFAAQRNYALEKASGEWVLYIDADEVVSQELKEEILRRVQDGGGFYAYYIKRRDFFWGSGLTYGEVYWETHKGIIRLVKKGAGQWVGRVHEVFDTRKKTGQLTNLLNHYPHQTINEFLKTINIYSTLRADEFYSSKIRTNIVAILLVPFFKFCLTYFILLGFLDGVPGFVYSFMMSFHSFLVRAKLFVKYET